MAVVNWARGSVRRQITIVLAVFAVLFAVNVAYVFNFLSASEGDSHVVNLAGRQRMLSQKMSKEAFAIAAGNESAREALDGNCRKNSARTSPTCRTATAERGTSPPPPASVVPTARDRPSAASGRRSRSEIAQLEVRASPTNPEPSSEALDVPAGEQPHAPHGDEQPPWALLWPPRRARLHDGDRHRRPPADAVAEAEQGSVRCLVRWRRGIS